MTVLARKSQILEDAGYVYSFDRQIYINRNARKVFSVEFVGDNTPGELLNRIEEEKQNDNWKFYFSSNPSAAAIHELESVLGK